MVTKAELEAEVAALRRQLAEQAKMDRATADTEPKDKSGEAPADWISENLDTWSSQLEEALTELDHLPHKKPILFALGIFTLGYLLGRSR